MIDNIDIENGIKREDLFALAEESEHRLQIIEIVGMTARIRYVNFKHKNGKRYKIKDSWAVEKPVERWIVIT